MSDRIRRNRNENYDQSDIDLFLDLVENHKHLIESMKQDDKKRVSSLFKKTMYFWIRINMQSNFRAGN